jgi:hypothetical protein
MSRQQTNREVRDEAQRFNETYHKLKAELRAAGIRNVHTSPKARKLIAIAATASLDASAQRQGRA